VTIIESLQERGIRRVGSPKTGFRYRPPNGDRLSQSSKSRIRRLVIPPAWRDVFVSVEETSPVQAIGRDRAGRWQYLYFAKQERVRERRKRTRLLAFLHALPRLRERVDRDLRRDSLTRERVLAAMVRLLLRGFLRPGSQAYAEENGSYGLSTLRPRHVRVRGRVVILTYRGKSGRHQLRQIEDSSAARVVAALLTDPGKQVFRFRTENGEWIDVRRRHVNAYIRDATGNRFSAKDIRTWAGTLLGACALARVGYPEHPSKRAIRRNLANAMKQTAQLLGNTPAVCRASYVSPQVVSAYERGKTLSRSLAPIALSRASSRRLASLEHRLARLIRNDRNEHKERNGEVLGSGS
jgi:DNA topoisomerase I